MIGQNTFYCIWVLNSDKSNTSFKFDYMQLSLWKTPHVGDKSQQLDLGRSGSDIVKWIILWKSLSRQQNCSPVKSWTISNWSVHVITTRKWIMLTCFGSNTQKVFCHLVCPEIMVIGGIFSCSLLELNFALLAGDLASKCFWTVALSVNFQESLIHAKKKSEKIQWKYVYK